MEWSRPDQNIVRSKWIQFFSDPRLSPFHLRKKAFQGNIKSLRSLYWRIFLGQLPYPTTSTKNLNKLKKLSWTLNLERSRLEWERFKAKFLRAPDGQWLQDSNPYCGGSDPSSSDHRNLFKYRPDSNTIDDLTPDLGVNNPLSQHEANPWSLWLHDIELRKTIQQDVIRTFPEHQYFRQTRTQTMLTNILHVYCKIHEDVGYRQGMHEVLGVLLETLDLDSLICPVGEKDPELMYQVLSREFLEHDVFNLFCLMMRPMKNWYDSNLSVPLRDLANRETTPLTSLGFIPSQLTTSIPLESNANDAGGSQLVHPIVEKCATIFHVYLKHLDPELWAHIDKLEIEPQLWGIRWLRLLFTREFTYQESLLLWDGIFAHDEDGTSLRLVDFICIAMLLRIRESLLESDYSGALQLILKFPQPLDGDSRMDLILYQAILLSRFPAPATAMLVIQQNLDLKLYSRHSPSIPRSNSWFSIGSKALTFSATAPITQNCLVRHHPPFSSLSAGTQQANPTQINQSLEFQGSADLRKTQTLGKHRSFLGALVDLRKSYSPTVRLENHSLTEPTPSTSTQLQPTLNLKNSNQSNCIKEDDQAKKNSHQLQPQQQQTNYLANQEVGRALRLCVDALEQNMLNKLEETHQEEEESFSHDSSQGLALGVLKHIRDVMLSGFSSSFDSNVMSPLIEYQSATMANHRTHADRSLEERRHSISSSSSLNNSDPSSPKVEKYSPSQSSLTTLDLHDNSFTNDAPDSIKLSRVVSSLSLSIKRCKSLESLNKNINVPTISDTSDQLVVSNRQDDQRITSPKILPIDLRYQFLDPLFLPSSL